MAKSLPVELVAKSLPFKLTMVESRVKRCEGMETIEIAALNRMLFTIRMIEKAIRMISRSGEMTEKIRC